MKLNFENFYAFEFTLGFLGVITGFYSLKYSLLFILLILGGCFSIFDSITRWNKSQKNKETLERLKLERENVTLDFDIKDIRAETDIDWYPDDVIDGQPVGFNEMYTVTYKIELEIYNPSLVDNIVRDIEVDVTNKKKKANKNITSTEDVNRIPVTIPPRSHKKLIFQASVDEMHGKKGDKLRITLVTMDNKRVPKDWEVKYYYDGPNLQETHK